MKEPFYLEPEDESMAKAAFEEYHRIGDTYVDRQQLILDTARTYGDTILQFLDPRLVDDKPELRHNVFAGAVDTIVSEVIQVHRRPMYVPRNASHSVKMKCERKTQWTDGLLDDHRMATSHAARDAVLGGTGFVFVTPGFNKPNIERLWSGNVHIDDRTCIDTIPRTVIINRFFDKRYLSKKYPDKEQEILDAPAPDPMYSWTMPYGAEDVVEVLYAIHLPSTPGADDGRIATCIPNALLDVRNWDEENYRLGIIRPVPPQLGFWGEALAKRAMASQEELDKWMFRIQQSMHLICIPRVFIRPGAALPKAMLIPKIGAVIVTQERPDFFTPQAMPAEAYNMLDRLEKAVYTEFGVSQAAAQSMKQPGVEAGVALRLVADIQSRRFMQLEESVSKATKDIVVYADDVMSDMVKEKSSLDVLYRGKDGTDISWKELDLKNDEFHVVLSQANALSTSASGKLQTLTDMMMNGAIDSYDMWSSITAPDLEKIKARYTAPKDVLIKYFDHMLETGKYIPPAPYLNLQLAEQVCVQTLLEATIRDVDQERLALLQTWLADVATMNEERMKAQQAAMMAQQAAQPQQGVPQ